MNNILCINEIKSRMILTKLLIQAPGILRRTTKQRINRLSVRVGA